MKKIPLLLALALVNYACEPNEEIRPLTTSPNYQQIYGGLEQVFQGAFDMAQNLDLISVVDQKEDKVSVKIEVDDISAASHHYFAKQFNSAPPKRVFYPAPPLSGFFEAENAIQTLERMTNNADAFNVPQKAYINGLSQDILAAENIDQGFSIVLDFRNQVSQAKDLDETQKLLLLEMAAGSQALLEFFKSGRADEVQSNLVSMLGNKLPAGKVAGCSVNWRNVWIGGVVGFSWGVARGLVLGATTGTVAVPVVGTVTGAISGAISLGAIGFIGGSAGAIAGDLIGTCFRSTRYNPVFSSCDQAWDAYLTNKINSMPADCFLVPMGIY